MYRIISIERLGNSVFKNEYEFEELKDARNKFNDEKNNKDIVDIILWFCTEIERFKKQILSSRHKPTGFFFFIKKRGEDT